ncbi:heme-molybdoenzyme heme-containing subunit YedZ; cytochrome b subunit [Magnetospirillum sp. LM-5]|uniref:sulfite oxidase heme-binding subunit YedZ n=1 Tax=Magnetospirillum sp. LM-5 TaxID=2681466 RepID=UPI001384AC36|nr:protein-methionine-sulfoxide reductase heme-binding subunit MsrQ [Magnetospirillum sp. LM-5]CAA7619966.1 heme-molybdoenzyme heme-containing subunit YedZ; cytochrome b subunit [Magnetospirillum sp. LM-5]
MATSAFKPVVFALCLLPLAWLVGRFWLDDLGVNPIETVNRFLGDWALRFLLIALAVTPVRQWTHWAPLARLRRMLGLYAFFYVCLHMASYIGLDLFFDWQTLWKDVLKRRYITLGMICFVLLLPLAATSTDAMVRWMGGKRWRALHKLVYPAGCLGVVHFWMMVKADIREPLIYALVLAVLLGWRAVRAFRQNPARVILGR